MKKYACALLLAISIPSTTWAAPTGPSPARDFRSVIASLVKESNSGFTNRMGAKLKTEDKRVYYNVKKPVASSVQGRQLLVTEGAHTSIEIDITAPECMALAHDAFLAMPSFQDKTGTYTIAFSKSESGPRKDVTNLFFNGVKVGSLTDSGGQAEILLIGTTGEKEQALLAPSLDARTQAFTTASQALVQRAAGNFAGMAKNLWRTTSAGDKLYYAESVPDMQTGDGGQIVMGFQNRLFYMNTWDDEKSVAFAQAAFLGLPQNIQKDGAYTISFDKSLDCAESCGWHLRYNGQLVADFVNYKNKPKALLTFGYRDGVPQPLAVASQRSAPVDTDKFTKSTCLGCHGFGREKKDFKNDYKDLSTGAIQSGYWVPCHWCKGTGLW